MPNCYYYDEQRNHCKCYVNENLNELLAENAQLRELVRDYHRFADAMCSERDCDGCSQRDEGACERGVLTSRECVLGVEVE